MKKITSLIIAVSLIAACNQGSVNNDESEENHMEKKEQSDFKWSSDRFADIEVLRYQIPSWDELTSKQRIYAYYLVESGLSGRDIIWDQNYRHNLTIRKVLENIITKYSGDKENEDWKEFM